LQFARVHELWAITLAPEEDDGTTLTGIWFCPLSDETAHMISKKYQLYK